MPLRQKATAAPLQPAHLTDDVRLYRTVVDRLCEALVVTDARGHIVVWSPRAEELFGWPAPETSGRPLELTVSAPGALPWTSDGPIEGVSRRVTLQRRNGEAFTAELRAAPIDIDGRHYRAHLFRDIADTLLAEQQLVQAQKLEAISHLTGGLAHDFNNILGIIIGSLDLVIPAITGDIERELVAAAQSAAHRGADITRALLAVARRRALKPQPTNVNDLIDELVPLLRQSAGKRIEVSFSANAIDAVCDIDAGGLNNALVNLVINSRDAMPDGGRVVIYAYTTEILPQALAAPLELKPGRYVVIGVDDTGTGMPAEVAMKAFDPFFTTKDRGRGTGLGLAMVYGFARQSGGTARIQSAPGRGTSVQLLLPAAEMPAERTKAEAAVPLECGHARILLVDDEPLLLRVASEWLRGSGHAVTTAANADEALALLAENRFDLLISDIAMPGSMDGLLLVERCRRLYPEMPALLATGFADGQAAALRTHAPVLDKPYTRTTLARAVAEALHQQGSTERKVAGPRRRATRQRR